MSLRWLTTLALLGLAKVAVAQTVRGAVVAEGERPIAGAIVILVDAGAKEVGRALTNERGEYRLTAPRPGSYRLRTLRIGFQSLLTEPMALVAGDDITRRLTVSTAAFTLDTVRSTGRNACRVLAGDSTTLVGSIWDQVRSALIATQLTLAARSIQSTSITYQRMQDARSQRIGSQTVDVRSEFARQPWRSHSPDSLRRLGFVYTLPDSSRVYNAPDLAVLLSDEFIEDHCLRISGQSDDRRLGIEFSPTSARRNTREIRGTLWLDRRTNELVELEYGYINRIRQDEERLAGGTVGFTRMKNGMWAISRWNIRMPMLALVPLYSPTFAVIGHQLRLDSLRVEGGELVMAVTTGARRDTIWMRPPLALRGTVLDSLSGRPVRDAIVALSGTVQIDTTDAAGRFSIGGVLPGRYSVNITTPSLDSVNTVDQRSIIFADSSMALTLRVPSADLIVGRVCGSGNTVTRLGSGIVTGSVTGTDSAGIRNARVTVQWTETKMTGTGPTSTIVESETRTDARGEFRVCGLHGATQYTFFAKTDRGSASPVRLKLLDGQRFGRVDLVVEPGNDLESEFTGVVVDSAGRALAEAEVAITDLGLATMTDAKGAFRIANVAPGNHSVTVRKVGYGPMDAKVDFVGGTATDRRILLTILPPMLDTVRTDASMLWREAPLLREFEENRKIGLGKFYTRADLAKAEGRSMVSLFEMPGFTTVTLNGGKWIKSTRTRSINPHCYELEDALPPITPRGINCGCFPIVFLDFQRLSDETRVPNINRFRADALEAVEFYRSGAETPQRYSLLNSQCGVIVLHSRRTK